MAKLNRITLIGTLTEDPRLAPESLGKNAATLNLVVKDSWTDKEKHVHESKDFFTVRLYGSPASYAAMNLGKDSTVLVIGKLRNEKWLDKESNTHKYKLVIVVDMGEGLQCLDAEIDEEFESDSPNEQQNAIEKPDYVHESVNEGTRNEADAGSKEFEMQHGLQEIPF